MRQTFNRIAIVAISKAGYLTARRLKKKGLNGEVYLPGKIASQCPSDSLVCRYDDGIIAVTKQLFESYDGLVYIMPTGIVVRAIAPFVNNKHSDPAVITVDVGGRWAVAMLSGHEGGANDLAAQAARALHAEPIITTSTEASKTLIAGIGCGKGVAEEAISAAIDAALAAAGRSLDDIRLVATVDAKEHEAGLLAFCGSRGLPLRILSREEIREARIDCNESEFVRKTLGIGAVAEPCALLGGSKTALILEKQIFKKVTVALAEEHPEW